MSFPNPIAATQGRGFGCLIRSHASRMTRRTRATLTLIALAAASLGSVGCQSVPLAKMDGSTARLVAAVDASLEQAPGRAYELSVPQDRGVMLAEAR